jgi:hypothetical protein
MPGTPGTVTGRGLNAAGILGWINALDQGLRGDGLGRDGTALMALFNAMPSGGGVIVLPPGTYNLDSSPSVPNNVTLMICAGVTLSGAGALSTAAGGSIVDYRNGLTVTGAVDITGAASVKGVSLQNHSVNGLLNNWQRVVQAYTASGGPAGPDHLFITLAGSDTISCTQDTANADSANGAQFDLACAFTLGTGAGASGIISGLGGHKLTTDNFRFWRGRQVTRTWRVRTNVATAARIAVTTDGTGGTTTYSSYHTGDGTWQTLTVTSPVIPTDATHVDFKVVMAASATVYVGAHATVIGAVGLDPYVGGPSPADDVARCQRYYRLYGGNANSPFGLSANGGVAADTVAVTYAFDQPMAVTPTVTKNGTWTLTNLTAQPVIGGKIDTRGFRVAGTATAAGFASGLPADTAGNVTVEANPAILPLPLLLAMCLLMVQGAQPDHVVEGVALVAAVMMGLHLLRATFRAGVLRKPPALDGLIHGLRRPAAVVAAIARWMRGAVSPDSSDPPISVGGLRQVALASTGSSSGEVDRVAFPGGVILEPPERIARLAIGGPPPPTGELQAGLGLATTSALLHRRPDDSGGQRQ